MSSRSFRFAPPAVEPGPVLAWLLRAAFSPVPLDAPPGPGEHVARLAEGLELHRRILHLRGGARLRALLGEDIERRWSACRRDVVARTLLVVRLAEVIEDAAREARAHALLLKGAALVLGGHTPPGVRRMADVDLLVPAAGEAPVRQALMRRGFVGAGLEEPHHSPPLVHAELGVVELHTSLPGLRLGDGSPLDVDALERDGLLVPCHRLPALLLPAPSFLAVHLASHALHQHGEAPAGYPGLRWMGDLLDLALSTCSPPPSISGSEPSREVVSLFSAATLGHLRTDLTERELRAAAALCESLRRGTLPPRRSDARRLLHHCLAGVLDEPYRGALRIRSATRALLWDRTRLRHRLRQRRSQRGRVAADVVGFALELGRDLRGWTAVQLRRRPRPLA